MKAWFLCDNCGKRQKLETGTVMVLEKKDAHEHEFLFGEEIKCRHCGKERIAPTPFETMRFLFKPLLEKMINKKESEIFFVNEETIIEETKRIKWKEATAYFEKKLEENPNDWVTLLRYGNTLQRNGHVNKALGVYEKVKQLNPNCVSPYVNLGNIFSHRVKEYGEKQFKEAAIENLSKAEELLFNKKGDMQTINDYDACLSEVVNNLSGLLKRNIFYEPVPLDELNGPLLEIVNPSKKMVPIHDMNEYKTIFFSIEKPVFDYWKQNSETTDETIIKNLESLKQGFDNPQNELGEQIKRSIKTTILLNKDKKEYSYGDIMSCIVRLKNLAKHHESFDGIGYLKWLERFFEGTIPQTPEEIEEYIKKEEIGHEITTKRGAQ